MMLYRGHILAGMAVAFGLLSFTCMWVYFQILRNYQDSIGVFLLFVAGALSVIVALVSAALAYVYWVPKWERVEKRTGMVPGERRKR